MNLEDLRGKAEKQLKDVNFKKMEPDARSCRLWYIKAQKKAIDYKKTFLCGLLMFNVAGLVLYIMYGLKIIQIW